MCLYLILVVIDVLFQMSQSLTWQYRQSILMDTARGLLYLHAADPEHPLIHRDVKTYVYSDRL